MVKRGVSDGYQGEVERVSSSASKLSSVSDGWSRQSNLDTTQAKRVSKIYKELSSIVAQYGSLARQDVQGFKQLGQKIVDEDRRDASR